MTGRDRRLGGLFDQWFRKDTDEHAHTWEEVTLPCAYHVALLPEPVLMHPRGHSGVQCSVCGGVVDITLAGNDPREYVEGWDYTGGFPYRDPRGNGKEPE